LSHLEDSEEEEEAFIKDLKLSFKLNLEIVKNDLNII